MLPDPWPAGRSELDGESGLQPFETPADRRTGPKAVGRGGAGALGQTPAAPFGQPRAARGPTSTRQYSSLVMPLSRTLGGGGGVEWVDWAVSWVWRRERVGGDGWGGWVVQGRF
jgi:hypothetical protein